MKFIIFHMLLLLACLLMTACDKAATPDSNDEAEVAGSKQQFVKLTDEVVRSKLRDYLNSLGARRVRVVNTLTSTILLMRTSSPLEIITGSSQLA